MYKKFILTLISISLLSFNAIAGSSGELVLSENEKPKKIKVPKKEKFEYEKCQFPRFFLNLSIDLFVELCGVCS